MKSEDMPSILGISGSPHADGMTNKLLKAVLDAATQEGAETKLINLYELNIVHEPGYYSKDPSAAIPKKMPRDDITALYPDIRRAEGIVLATPTYWANMSGVMKDFIDHLTPLENEKFALQGKIAAFIAVSKENEGGVEMAAMSMVAALCQMGMLIPPNAVMWFPGSWHTSTKTVDSWAVADAPVVGKNMVKLIKLLRQSGIKWG
jgi:multimeric flavodoxin WrbA